MPKSSATNAACAMESPLGTHLASDAFRAGVSGYLLKVSPGEELSSVTKRTLSSSRIPSPASWFASLIRFSAPPRWP